MIEAILEAVGTFTCRMQVIHANRKPRLRLPHVRLARPRKSSAVLAVRAFVLQQDVWVFENRLLVLLRLFAASVRGR